MTSVIRGSDNMDSAQVRPVLMAAQAASGTSVDFTGIPDWAQRVTVMFSGVSTNGTSNLVGQLGTSGGIASSGYSGTAWNMGNASGAFSTSFIIALGVIAANNRSGVVTFVRVTGNTWAMSAINAQNVSGGDFAAGAVSLSGTLDRIRITTANGTDTFDAGTISVMYE